MFDNPLGDSACEWDSNSHIVTFEGEHYFPSWKQPTERKIPVGWGVCFLAWIDQTLFLPLPFLRAEWSLWKMFCKLSIYPQISAVVLDNQLYIHLKKNQTTTKTPALGGIREVTESNLPYSSGPLQMKTRWHLKQTTSKWNVSGMWCNVKHHKLLEHKDLPQFLQEAFKSMWNSYFHSRSL